MFVQLLRVVYLLVLLQCCVGVCLVRAERGTTGNGDPAPKVKGLKAGLSGADEVFLNANACLSVWKNEVKSYNNNVSPVKDAAEKIKGFSAEIKKAVLSVENKGSGPVTMVHDKVDNNKVATLVKKTTEAIQETENAADKAKESITKIRNAKQFCLPYIDKAKQVEEKKKLEEEYKQKLKEFTDQITDSETAMETAKKEIETTIISLDSQIRAQKEKKNEFTATKGKIEEAEKAIQAGLEKITETKQLAETQEKQVEPVKMDELVKKLEAEVQRLKAEKQTPTEQEKEEKGQTRVEEGKNPSEEKGEKGTKEQGAQANGGSKEKPQRGAEKETNTTAEANLQTTEAPVKERQEKGETTGDSTQKPGESLNDVSGGTVSNISLQPIISGTSDSSNSPALMHSPLLLLLLCVLGSILVC